MKGRLSGFLQSNFNVAICRTIGWHRADRWVRFLGRLYFFFRWREKKIIWNNIGTVFANGRQNPRLRHLYKAVLNGITLHYYEKLFNAYCSEERSRRFFDTKVVDEGIETVRQARESGRGVLLVTGHYGGVEFMPGYLGFRGLPVSIVVRFASDRLRRLSRTKGGRFGIEIIDADGSPSVFFSICRHLKQNRVVITQCDEVDAWRTNGASPLSFLGRRVAPDRALSLLVRRTRCPVVFAAMHRNPELSYRFLAARSEAIEPAGRYGAGETGLKFIESLVRRHPHQWYQWVKLPVAEEHRAFRPGPLRYAQRPFLTTSAEGTS